ncbi:hypothetical protein HYC85_005091 [Camellia sinensis]|uniref:Uncharacterized protein n=1 Tax=Camellia sinensis TaxID=4442 RepID=A0A7J7I0A7_CAMSI|nr:hypothetical protein HYC85_005091 [Camellia sinensis]
MASTNVTTYPKPMKATSNGAFQGENPLDYALPLAILQICVVVAFTRSLAFILKPLRQPRVIAEIIVSNTILSCSLFLASNLLSIVAEPEN